MLNTKKQLTINIKRIIDAILLHEKTLAPLKLIPESPVNESFYAMVRYNLEGFSEDHRGWIEWYFWECDFGRKPQKAALQGEEMRPVDTVDKLVDFMLG